jgi:hypothetical protein
MSSQQNIDQEPTIGFVTNSSLSAIELYLLLLHVTQRLPTAWKGCVSMPHHYISEHGCRLPDYQLDQSSSMGHKTLPGRL